MHQRECSGRDSDDRDDEKDDLHQTALFGLIRGFVLSPVSGRSLVRYAHSVVVFLDRFTLNDLCLFDIGMLNRLGCYVIRYLEVVLRDTLKTIVGSGCSGEDIAFILVFLRLIERFLDLVQHIVVSRLLCFFDGIGFILIRAFLSVIELGDGFVRLVFRIGSEVLVFFVHDKTPFNKRFWLLNHITISALIVSITGV